jgi:hypothetical protein
VLDFPTLEYWLGAVLAQSGLTKSLVDFCCGVQRNFGLLTHGTDLLDTLLAEAVRTEGHVKEQSVYKLLGAFVKSLISKLTSN